jgi:fermentation-respiration switch protein FrsA (DUF1100 family)
MYRQLLLATMVGTLFAATIQAEAPAPLNFRIQSYQPSPHRIVYLYAHGLGSTHLQGLKLYPRIKGYDGSGKHAYHTNWIIDGPMALFDFADAKNDNNEFLRKHVNLGQELDVLRLDQAYQRTLQQIPDDYMVVVLGLSRGATTILNWLALRQPHRVAAAIIESAFDSLDNVIAHIIKKYKMSWVPLSHKMGSGIMSLYFPSIDLNGIVPIKTVSKIQPEIPILLVHSKKDQVIPVKSSRNIYCQLAETGHSKVHLLELPAGKHGKVIKETYGSTFQNAAHAFFAHYNLPHDPDLAAQGAPTFNGCQPSVNLVKQLSRTIASIDDDVDNEEI